MDFFVDYETLQKMAVFREFHFHKNGDIFLENSSTLLKAIPEDITKMLFYLKEIPEHPHIVKPKEVGKIIYPSSKNIDIYQSAYRMEHLINAQNLYSLNKKDIPYEEKLKYNKQFFEALQYLHQYIVLGDIQPGNLLIANQNAYICDLDNSQKLQNFLTPIFCDYYITNLKWLGNTKYTDIVKMYLECLAFILGIRFEGYIKKFGYKKFYKVLTSYPLPPEVSSFLKYCKHPSHLKSLEENAYNFEQFMTEDVLSLKKTLSFYDYYE